MYLDLKYQVAVMKDNLSNIYHLTLAFLLFQADKFSVIQHLQFEDLHEKVYGIRNYISIHFKKLQYTIADKFISFLFWYKIPLHKSLQVEFQTTSGLEIVFMDNKVTNNLLS